jgi:hypothetical protein
MTKSSGMILNSSAGPERVSIMDDTNNQLPVMRIRKIKSQVDFINAFPGIYPLGQLHYSAVQNGSIPFCGKDATLLKHSWMKERWLLVWPMLTLTPFAPKWLKHQKNPITHQSNIASIINFLLTDAVVE